MHKVEKCIFVITVLFLEVSKDSHNDTQYRSTHTSPVCGRCVAQPLPKAASPSQHWSPVTGVPHTPVFTVLHSAVCHCHSRALLHRVAHEVPLSAQSSVSSVRGGVCQFTAACKCACQ